MSKYRYCDFCGKLFIERIDDDRDGYAFCNDDCRDQFMEKIRTLHVRTETLNTNQP